MKNSTWAGYPRQTYKKKAWFPACSFLEDTATTLVAMFMAGRQGLFHLDGNPGLNQYEIGSRINKMLGNPWEITPVNAPVMNSLMKDSRIAVRSILESLSAG